MNIHKIGDFSFVGNTKVSDKQIQVKEAVPELQDKEIFLKVDISKEGLAALRKSVQEMPGHIDFEKEMQFREILPKLQMDPAGSLYSEMRSEWQSELNDIKEYNGSIKYLSGDLLNNKDFINKVKSINTWCCNYLKEV